MGGTVPRLYRKEYKGNKAEGASKYMLSIMSASSLSRAPTCLSSCLDFPQGSEGNKCVLSVAFGQQNAGESTEHALESAPGAAPTLACYLWVSAMALPNPQRPYRKKPQLLFFTCLMQWRKHALNKHRETDVPWTPHFSLLCKVCPNYLNGCTQRPREGGPLELQ